MLFKIPAGARLAALLAAVCCAGCGEAKPQVAIVGDLEKPTGSERVVSSDYLLKNGTISIAGAGNETVAFQAIMASGKAVDGLDVSVSDLSGPGTIPSGNFDLFLEHYATTEDASYSWGARGGAGVLPWKGIAWPDALIPFRDPYDSAHPTVATPFAIDPAGHPNQGVWVDLFIPKGSPAGVYRGEVRATQRGNLLAKFPLALTVRGFDLPDANHVDAFGELYRENGTMFDSGVKFKEAPEKDWTIYKRYLQMAHAHRFLAAERAENGPIPRQADGAPAIGGTARWDGDWNLYSPYIGKILDGSIFTAAEGYRGPGIKTPPAFFPAPFQELFYGDQLGHHLRTHDGTIDPALTGTIEHNAAAFWKEAAARGWTGVRWFAYLLDEVDGAVDTGEAGGNPLSSVEKIHAAMREMQEALDRGTGGKDLALVWTSHTNPAHWNGTAAQLQPFVRWWIPNGDALNPDFFSRLPQGDAAAGKAPPSTVWFYHSGRPAIGNHTINQTGVDLELWGLLCRRYNINGSFWWSMMDFSGRWDDAAFNPYAHPVYKEGETRWGNGVLFYPGSRLTMIGAARNIAGPIPSMRMQAYRRGLQDYEYCWLADQAGKSAEVDALLKALIPAAFSEALAPGREGKPASWSERAGDYEKLRVELADIIATTQK